MDADTSETQLEVEEVQPKMNEGEVRSFAIQKDKLDDLFFENACMGIDVRNYLTGFLTNILYHYRTEVKDLALEFPSGIPPEKRDLMHWVAEALELGSLVKGRTGGKGMKKRIVIGHISLNPG
jgi:hypothetical protein